jgi:hypothetical protein
MIATCLGGTDIQGTLVPIIAVRGNARAETVGFAFVLLRARVTVITAYEGAEMNASANRVARVVGAGVTVVTVDFDTHTDTAARAALIGCAWIAVLALSGVDGVQASAGVHVTVIEGAGVAVVAEVDRPDTTHTVNQGILAAEGRITPIHRTIIAIIAGHLASGNAGAVLTDVDVRAEVIVGTYVGRGQVYTASRGTQIVRTRKSIIAR